MKVEKATNTSFRTRLGFISQICAVWCRQKEKKISKKKKNLKCTNIVIHAEIKKKYIK